MFKNAPDAMYLNDMKGFFLDGNKASETLTSYPREELIGKNFLQINLLSVSSLAKAAKFLVTARLNEPQGPIEYEINKNDNSKAVAEILTIPIKYGDKIIEIGIARDITKRKKDEELLRIKTEELEKFNNLSVSRELKMVELKDRIEKLEAKINAK